MEISLTVASIGVNACWSRWSIREVWHIWIVPCVDLCRESALDLGSIADQMIVFELAQDTKEKWPIAVAVDTQVEEPSVF